MTITTTLTPALIATPAVDATPSLQERLLGTWVRAAACAGFPVADFEPIVGTTPTAAEYAVRATAARRLCAGCPVLRRCGRWADDHAEAGLWGGALRYERDGSYVALPLFDGAPRSRHEVGLDGAGERRP